ncbi:NmrA family NAD(P)-binding protein [Kitasatospora kifunensis]|uniref:NAD(P)H dehydrogenase (Quinone) n=1 Tax=Kitasatospora kifunensis TaxID=58351 RepID=A0A7W7R2R8_KITKI|nr:NmrA family NAD(P)-binding protein [Kitasatospora kifunensis]MBB4924215.1 NAD(P)H dehydrogenase (quinone) [Kitasatospora kifunensis]
MILVTGTSGALGGLIHRRLVQDGAQVLAGTRSPGPGERRIDFDDPATLRTGFAGVDVLVLVSAGYAEDDVVIARHGAAIDAAVAAGVRHVIYTSLAGSGDQLTIALPHRWTERALAASPLDWTVLRNGLYVQVPAGLGLANSPQTAATGVFRAPWGVGSVPVVAREDLAEAAARVALEADGGRGTHAARVYELEGAVPVGGSEIAAALTEALGRPVRYQNAPLGESWERLAGAGMAAYQVAHAVSIFSAVNAGAMAVAGHSDLPALLGGQVRDVRELLGAVVRELVAAAPTPESRTE